MRKLTHTDLFTLEHYARTRADFRSRIIEHKKHRRLPLGPHATLFFEDRMTMQYQVQEMLRIERIFEPEGIADELDVYNPLIPDGRNLKASFMLEYPDEVERRRELAKLVGVERCLWMAVAGHGPVHAIANEDLERSTDTKTASVHFVRFEFTPEMIVALKSGADLFAGIEHPECHLRVTAPEPVRVALMEDFD